jgi:hypothetical protein
MKHPFPIVLPCVLAAALSAQSPQFQVVPAAYTNSDAVSYEWIAGASRELRQQTLIGASHLSGMVGRELRALELRRTAVDEVYQGGTAQLEVRLSISPRTPLDCSPKYLDNVGPQPVLVFQGQVTLPTSPAHPGSQVAWTPANVVRVPFQVPFVYLGGTLLVDILGTPIAGQTADWWMADAEFEDLKGTAVQVGAGCGIYGGAQREWSHVAPRTLLPGAHARFWAYGTPNGLALAVFGAESAVPIPLASFGITTPGCNLHLQPGLILATNVTIFEPESHPLLAAFGATAEARLKLPAAPWLFGFTLTTQWLDMAQMASSNAIRWSVAHAIPSLDMALVEGAPSESSGEVSVHLAHVLRLEYQ